MVQLILGKERSIGTDLGKMVPRCLMAAQFRTEADPSGERMLRHWVAQGQIQDRLSFRIYSN